MYIDDLYRHSQVTTTTKSPLSAKESNKLVISVRENNDNNDNNSKEATFFQNFVPAERLKRSDLNQNLLKVRYAIRGRIPSLAETYKSQLEGTVQSGLNPQLPFDSVILANIGNPQELGQKPLTFTRQVLSLLEYPQLLEQVTSHGGKTGDVGCCFNADALRRATSILNSVKSMGAYSPVQGFPSIRKSVADFLERRDQEPASSEDIFLTNGATAAITYLFNALCKGSSDGVLLPVPEYPLYTALATIHGSTLLPYYLEEEEGEDSNWSINTEEIEQRLERMAREGTVKPTIMVVINPGNPTGSVLSTDTIARILRLSAKFGFAVLADEVYQENVFPEFATFYSFKKVLCTLKRQFPGTYDSVQLCSVHSTSKGVTGECGHRGGYMELVGFSEDVRNEILKAGSLDVCSSTPGQVVVDLMVNPPRPGDESFDRDQLERRAIRESLQQRCTRLYEMLSSLEGIECKKPQGAMYLFPRLTLPRRALEEAARQNMSPDEFYCIALLKRTGICTVPGTGFGQRKGTYHLRTTFLAPGTEWIDRWRVFHKEFYAKYSD